MISDHLSYTVRLGVEVEDETRYCHSCGLPWPCDVEKIRRVLAALVVDFDHVVGCPAMEGVTAPFGARMAAEELFKGAQ